MAVWNVEKTNKWWYVMCDGEVVAGFKTKKAATEAMKGYMETVNGGTWWKK